VLANAAGRKLFHAVHQGAATWRLHSSIIGGACHAWCWAEDDGSLPIGSHA